MDIVHKCQRLHLERKCNIE